MKATIIGLLALLALLAVSATASAEPAASRDDLTIDQVRSVMTGLRNINRYETVDKDGKATIGYYKYAGDVRILIALDLDIANRIDAVFISENNALIARLSGGGVKVPDDRMGEYNATARKMLDAPCRCALYKIKMGDLKLDENAIPADALALLIPIIDR